MNNRDAYWDMQEQVDNIAKKYNVDLTCCDVFEETLLLIAGVEEKPNGCSFSGHTTAQTTLSTEIITKEGAKDNFKYCVISFPISRESAEKFVLFYMNRFPKIDIEDITVAVNQMPETEILKSINNQRTMIIKIDANDVSKYLLPLVDEYLHKNPHVLKAYSDTAVSYDTFWKLLKADFMKEGVDIDVKNYFEQTLCYLVQAVPARAKTIEVASSLYLPLTLLGIIYDFLNIHNYPETEVSHINTVECNPRNERFQYQTGLFFSITNEHVAPLVQYLSSYYHRISNKPFKGSGDDINFNTKLTVFNQVFLHPGLSSDLHDTLVDLPQLDQFRKTSGCIKQTLEECLAGLEKARFKILENNVFQTRTSSILVQYISDLVETVKLRDSSVEQVNESIGLVEAIQRVFKEFGRKRLPGMFSNVPSEEQSQIIKMITVALTDISIIVNKNFSADKSALKMRTCGGVYSN